jgi:O-antigen/teichoic acid export membrane protein
MTSTVGRWSRWWRLVQPGPFDTSTPEGRASERHRRVTLSAITSALAKLTSVGTALLTVPLTLHYLGPERYGLWMTISSLVVILAFADFGIGNGILNAVARAHGSDDVRAVRVSLSSGYCVLGLVALVLLAMLAASYAFVPWPSLFAVQTELARQEVGPAVAVFIVCFALAVPLGIVQRVQIGLQRSFLASLWQCLASVLGLLGVIVAIQQQAGLPWLVLAFFGAPLLAGTLNTLVFFGRTNRELAPRRALVSAPAAAELVRSGALFFVLQLVVGIAYASDSLVITHVLGPAAVADYAVPERLFSLVTVALGMFLAPLWPAYGEAIARGDTAWARRTLLRSTTGAVLVAALCAGALVLLGPLLIKWWVGTAVQAPLMLLLGLALWKVIEAGGTALAVFLNGANVVRSQVILATLTAVSALTLKVVLVGHLGVAGTVWATICAYLVCTAVPMAFLVPRILRSLGAPRGQP